MRKGKRDHILSVASELFYKQGIQATGVDQIVAESGVAKMTLYNHFPSKDDLVSAYLARRDELWLESFEARVRELGEPSGASLLALFDALEEWFRKPDFYGCAFIHAAAEFSSVSHPFHLASQKHKVKLLQFIHTLVREAGVKEENRTESLANALFLLVEGAIVTAMVQGEPAAALRARETAQDLLTIYLS